MNVIKPYLMKYLNGLGGDGDEEEEEEGISFIVKKNNNFMVIKTKKWKFLDIMNFLAPGFSYDKFLKAYECTITKGFFPYQYVDSLDKLQETELPPHEAFYSDLKKSNISTEEYAYCQQVWRDQNMQTFQDFLVWYNNR